MEEIGAGFYNMFGLLLLLGYAVLAATAKTGGDEQGEWVERLVERLGEHQAVVRELPQPVTIRFVDRVAETRLLMGWLGYGTVSVVVGPKGCGKTELARAIATAVRKARSPVDVVYVKREVSESEARTIMETVSKRFTKKLADAIRKVLSSTPSVEALGAEAVLLKGVVVSAANILDALAKMKYGRRPVTIFVDEFLGKACGFEVRQELEVRANDVSYLLTYHNVKVKLIYLTSNATAARLVPKVGGKVRWLLIWNLPREPFKQLYLQLKPPQTMSHKLAWQLTGGNPRELARLALEWNWSIENYLRSQLATLVDTLSRYAGSQNLNSSEVVEEAARLLNTLSSGIPPKLVEALEEANIIINVSLYSHRLTPLPEAEPWIGQRWAFQVPTHYWTLKTIVEEETLDIKPSQVLKRIREHVER